MARAIESGTLSVNSNSSVRYATPFGGFKQSGIGRDLGMQALDHYSETKTVYVRPVELIPRRNASGSRCPGAAWHGRRGRSAGTAGGQGRAHHRRRGRARSGRRRAVRARGRPGRHRRRRRRGRRGRGDRRRRRRSGVRRDRRDRRRQRRAPRWRTPSRRSAGCTCSTTTPASPPPTTTARRTRRDDDVATGARRERHRRLARCCRHGIPAMLDSGGGQHRQRRVVRRPHGRGDAADRLHRVEGRACWR